MRAYDVVIDNEYEEVAVAAVSGSREHGWSITRADGWSFVVPASSPIEPRVGQVARFYGPGIGSVVRGLTLDRVTVFYRTEAEQRATQEADKEADRAKRAAEVETNAASYQERIAALPEPFRARFAKFRARPGWDAEFLAYELFVCEEAVKIADALGTADAVREFHGLAWERQREIVPALNEDHSGNTFGAACTFARLYLVSPADVPRMHGAIVPLVGCEQFGCHGGAA